MVRSAFFSRRVLRATVLLAMSITIFKLYISGRENQRNLNMRSPIHETVTNDNVKETVSPGSSFNKQVHMKESTEFQQSDFFSFSKVENRTYLRPWFEFAQENKCLVNHDFPQIELDMVPFRYLAENAPRELQSRIKLLKSKLHRSAHISIRNKNLESSTGSPYDGIISRFASYLPDMDIFVSDIDEPRVLASTKPEDIVRPIENIEFWNDWDRDKVLGYVDGFCASDPVYQAARDTHGFFGRPATFSSVTSLVPIFSQTKTSCFADILIPSWMHYNAISFGGLDIPWSEKKDVLFWRGSTTGARYVGPRNTSLWPHFHRPRLVKFGMEHPNIGQVKTDIGFVGAFQCFDGSCESLERDYAQKEKVSASDFYSFKYLMDVDGNSFSQRFFDMLHHSSLVFRSGIFLDWFTDRLKPFQHYVPIKPDLSDLEQWVLHYIKNQNDAERIAKDGGEFGNKWLTRRDMDCYMFRVLLEYGEVLRIMNDNLNRTMQ